MATEGNLSEKSEALSLQPDPSFSQTGTGIIVEGGEAEEFDLLAEKCHVEAKGTNGNAGPDRIGPGKIQSCWSVSLKNMPKFSEVQLNEKLITNSSTMPDNKAPKAYRNKLQGYKLWKEGYVSSVMVKPNVPAGNHELFLVKSNVSAAMKNQRYDVYVHLEHETGKANFAKCSCKAGQGGCCKHIAAMLYTLLDYCNLGLQYVPEDVSCTQVLQKWNAPGRKVTSNTAVKFTELEFERADYNRDQSKKRKRPVVTGSREGYCATPLFARNASSDDIEQLSAALEKAGKATLFVETLKGNQYKPCKLFKTTCNVINAEKSIDSNADNASTKFTRIDVFASFPDKIDILGEEHLRMRIKERVGVTLDECRTIEKETQGQSDSKIWHLERSKRLTSSLFGRIINRRKAMEPKSLLGTIQKTGKAICTPALKWGRDKEKVALQQYLESHCDPRMKVMECGLIINPRWPWLGASPDGLLIDTGKVAGGIEIKCPFSKKEMNLADACKDKKFFLEMSSCGPKLKSSHAYFYQCQGIMNIAGLQSIDFVVYTEKEMFVEKIMCDETLWNNKMLPELTKFYVEFLL